MAHGLDGNGLTLQNRKPFLDNLKQHVPERKVKPLEPYIYSIDHKLNVARYSAGLIRAMRPEDYGRLSLTLSIGCTTVEYPQRCVYYVNDLDQYELSLLFFIESFAAAAFSLFDSCGHLLVGIYNLSLPRETQSDPKKSGSTKTIKLEANFINAFNDLNGLGAMKMYQFLHKYQPGHSESLLWVGPLKKLRNHTTHAEVTDIVELATSIPLQSHAIRLRRERLEPFDAGLDIELNKFVEKCFDGLEEFVEQLYDKVHRQVGAERDLPLTGRFDHLV